MPDAVQYPIVATLIVGLCLQRLAKQDHCVLTLSLILRVVDLAIVSTLQLSSDFQAR